MYPTTRLDVPTQGLLVLAKSRAFARKYNRLIAGGKVRKEYRALVRPRIGGEEGEGPLLFTGGVCSSFRKFCFLELAYYLRLVFSSCFAAQGATGPGQASQSGISSSSLNAAVSDPK